MIKILLCDDDQESAAVLESLLKKRGLQVIRPGQFLQLEILLDQARPDLLLLDMCLPDVSAGSVIEHARSRGIPVLAFSGMSSWRQEALDAGCIAFLEKPFSVRQVLEFVDRHVKAS
ncbi:response regulator [Oligoflexus tunisiensis]|uniref:response regulator n=1 Tax=Oligoflexus tunisiensis TaxID=708132 RepID=UPI00114D009A|nr:response regulator [Oligoflexus tunisiensis]